MSTIPLVGDGSLTPTMIEHIEQVCDQFEVACKAGHRPRVADYLGETTEPERSALARELALLETAYRGDPEESPPPVLDGTTLPVAGFDAPSPVATQGDGLGSTPLDRDQGSLGCPSSTDVLEEGQGDKDRGPSTRSMQADQTETMCVSDWDQAHRSQLGSTLERFTHGLQTGRPP